MAAGSDQAVMFPTTWHTASDTTSKELAASDDSYNWHFLPNAEVLDTAPFGAWYGGYVLASPNLIELPNGDRTLPYAGYAFPHKYPRTHWRFGAGLAVSRI